MSRTVHKYMAAPAALLFSVFFVYPLLRGIATSFTDWNGYSAPEFIGFENFVRFFGDERALRDVGNTLLFALGSTPLLNIVGLGLALLLNSKIKARSAVRTLVYLPAVISPMIMGSIWYLLIQPGRGMLFVVLESLGLGLEGNWMNSGFEAMWVVILINVWQFGGMTMVVYLAGLQTIPTELYEAASIDGAGRLRVFWSITIPQLWAAIRINIVTNIIGSMSVFDIILALTGGGPGYETESLSIYILRMSYGNKVGYSTAVAMILFVIIMIPVAISLRMLNKKETS